MTMRLQIDTKGLEALFPEGQARVDLQNAVTAEFARKHFDRALVDNALRNMATEMEVGLAAKINKAKQETADVVAAKLGLTINPGYYRDVNLPPAIALQIETGVRDAITARIKEAVESERAKVTEQVTMRLSELLRTTIRDEVHRQVSKALATQVGEAVMAAIQTSMQKLSPEEALIAALEESNREESNRG